MNQREKDIFVISLIGIVLASIPGLLYITQCIGEELFEVFNYIGKWIFIAGLGINIRTLTLSNWLQNKFKLKIILTVLYSNALLALWYFNDYLYATKTWHGIKYSHVKPLFIAYPCLSIFFSAFVIISIIKKQKKLNSHPA
ncbi:MAG: hypothetical protein PHX21_09365 [bacterium]|nr:hypothetical protein [bacterium]